MCTFWLSLVKKYIYIIYSSSYSDDWKYLHLHKVVSWCLDLHFFFLWSQWNASHIPGENVIQPKNKFDDLVHNLYTAKRNLRDSRNSKLSVLTGCLCRPLRRGATVSLHSDITRGGPEWLILGRQWSEKENKHHCLLAFLFLKTCLWKKKKTTCLWSAHSTSIHWDFPGGPVVKIPFFHCRGHRFDPWPRN